jgi:IMP dehydrogenase/GMP reductase
MAKETKDQQVHEAAKLDAIKEIIFGQNMREYEREFTELREYINNNLNAIDKEFQTVKKAMDDMEKRLTSKMEANHQKVMDELAKLDDKKLDRRKLGKMLMDIGEKISS